MVELIGGALLVFLGFAWGRSAVASVERDDDLAQRIVKFETKIGQSEKRIADIGQRLADAEYTIKHTGLKAPPLN